MEEPPSYSNATVAFSNLESSEDLLSLSQSKSHLHEEECSGDLATSAVSCLICGTQFLPSSAVKQKPVDEDGGVFPVRVEEVVYKKWEEEEELMFQWLLKWLNLNVKVKNIIKWDTATEAFPFCGSCKSSLAFILDVRRKIDELEERLKGGIVELREKVIASEIDVQLSGVYLRDERYLKLRRQVTEGDEQGVTVTRRGNNAKKTKPHGLQRDIPKTEGNSDRAAPLRKSGRAPKPVEILQIESSFSESFPFPVVRLSAEDKAKAEKIQRGNLANLNHELKIEADPEVSRRQTKAKIFGREKRKGSDLDLFASTSDIGGRKLITSDQPSPSKRRRRVKVELKSMEDSVGDDDGDFLFDDAEDQYPVMEDDNWSPEKDFGQNSSKKEVKQRRAKKKLRKKNFKLREDSDDEFDADFVPDEEGGGSGTDSDGLDDDDDVKAGEWLPKGRKHLNHKKPESLKEDPTTGVATYMNIQFTPVVNETDKYSCGKCSRSIKKSLSNFRSHVFRMHTDRAACTICNFRGTFESDLRRHTKIVHEDGGCDKKRRKILHYDCDICGKSVYGQVNLRKHRYTHYNEEEKLEAIARGEKVLPPKDQKVVQILQCEDCGKEFGGINNLTRHKLCVHGSKEERKKASELCSLCGKSVLSFRMQRHMKLIHPTVPERYSCLTCDKIFSTKRKLRDHKRVHQERPFKCELCGKGFVTQNSFTGHMNLHNDVRPFNCEHCPLSFASKKQIMKHTKAFHTAGSKPRRAPYLRGLEKSSRVDVKRNNCEESERVDFKTVSALWRE